MERAGFGRKRETGISGFPQARYLASPGSCASLLINRELRAGEFLDEPWNIALMILVVLFSPGDVDPQEPIDLFSPA